MRRYQKLTYMLLVSLFGILAACGSDGGGSPVVPSSAIQIKSASFELLPIILNGTLVYSSGYQIALEYTGDINLNLVTTNTLPPFALTLDNYSSGISVKKTYPGYVGLGAGKTVLFHSNGGIGNVARRSFGLTITDWMGRDSDTYVFTGRIPPALELSHGLLVY
jgi:hypothetical protein